MSEAPVCRKCSKPHWRFVACDQADEHRATQERNQQRRVEAYPIRSVPDGYRVPDPGLPAHPARTVPDGYKPYGTFVPDGFRVSRGTTNNGPKAA